MKKKKISQYIAPIITLLENFLCPVNCAKFPTGIGSFYPDSLKKIPWTEESGGLQFMGSQESDMTEHSKTHPDSYPRVNVGLISICYGGY